MEKKQILIIVCPGKNAIMCIYFFCCLNYYETVVKLPSIFLTLNIAAPL